MRIATGNISHESSFFTPIPTPYEAFACSRRALFRGSEVIEGRRDTNTGCGGFIDAAEQHGFELVPLIWTFAQPSGPVEALAWRRLNGEFLERLEAAMPVDGALFDLHGAMVIEDIEDGEGDLLTAVREILGPDRPVMVTLDLHCNITQRMVDMADALIPCDNYPHTDLRERGREAADLIVRTIRGEIRPAMAWKQLPMLWIGGQFTGLEPFDSIIARAHSIEAQPGILTASVAPGFAWADIHDAGSSVVVVADGDRAPAQREAGALGDWIYAQREQFLPDLIPFEEAMQKGRAAGRWPVVMADVQDNPGGGCPGDSTGMLRAFLEAGLEDALILTLCDPEVAAAATEAGEGAEITVDVGGKSAPEQGPPVRLDAWVERVMDLRFTLTGPMNTGVTQDLGPSAVLRSGGVRVVVATNRLQVFDLECPRTAGVEPTEMKWIGIKSANHFRAAYGPIAGSIFRVDFPACIQNDPRKLRYERLRRPIWPLDL